MLKIHAFGRDDVLSLREFLDQSSEVTLTTRTRNERTVFVIQGKKPVLLDDRVIGFELEIDPARSFLLSKMRLDRDDGKFVGAITRFIELDIGVHFPLEASWKMELAGTDSGNQGVIKNSVIDLEFHDGASGSLEYSFPEGMIVRVFEDEPISGTGYFTTTPTIRVIQNGTKPDKVFPPDKVREFEEFRKNLAPKKQPGKDQSEIQAPTEDASFATRRSIGVFLFNSLSIASMIAIGCIVFVFVRELRRH